MEERLKQFFLDPCSYPHATTSIRHIETHISDVFLTGAYAYKVKRSVKFDFLDFSTLEKRRYFCERELTLNRRFAPDLYESIVTVVNLNGKLCLCNDGRPVEYAIKMKQLDENSLFTDLLRDGKLTPQILTEVTRDIAHFHKGAERRPDYWSFELLKKWISENIKTIGDHSPDIVNFDIVRSLAATSEMKLNQKKEIVQARQHCFVKALHGDLHLRNIALLNGRPVLFDGIEFNDDLSCCDVWADVAFLIMDLIYRDHPQFANSVTNTYLEESDDYQGLSLLKLYGSYRAQVRAKVSCLEYGSVEDQDQKQHAKLSALRHTMLALELFKQSRPFIIAIGGLSGTGKTTLARALAAETNAIHVRSDVIRKHLLGLNVLEHAGNEAHTPELDHLVYDGMRIRAEAALDAGYSVILDAVHRTPAQRERIRSLGYERGCPFMGIWCSVPLDIAKERVRTRKMDASDADEDIVEEQFKTPSSKIEWETFDTDCSPSFLLGKVKQRFDQIRAATPYRQPGEDSNACA